MPMPTVTRSSYAAHLTSRTWAADRPPSALAAPRTVRRARRRYTVLAPVRNCIALVTPHRYDRCTGRRRLAQCPGPGRPGPGSPRPRAPAPGTVFSGQGAAKDLPGSALRPGVGTLAGSKAEAFVEHARTAGLGAGVVRSEGHDFERAGTVHEPAHGLSHERAPDPQAACPLGDDELVNMVGRRLGTEQQATEQVWFLAVGSDQGRAAAHLCSERAMESGFFHHRPEPLFHLRGQREKGRYVPGSGEPDTYRSSLPEPRHPSAADADRPPSGSGRDASVADGTSASTGRGHRTKEPGWGAAARARPLSRLPAPRAAGKLAAQGWITVVGR
jgi:hypothetical protein